MQRKNKGFFITFEGGEGAGKTTLINRVFETLTDRGHSVVQTREPGGTSLGQEIRKLLLHQKDHPVSSQSELFLYLADRAQHVQELILPALESGQIILCDRFNDSTLAYQGAARALDVTVLRDLCYIATDHLVPDLTLFLDLDPKIGLERAKQKQTYDRLEEETLDFHIRVRKAFLSLSKEEPERFHIIDASKDLETVYAAALKEIETILCLK